MDCLSLLQKSRNHYPSCQSRKEFNMSFWSVQRRNFWFNSIQPKFKWMNPDFSKISKESLFFSFSVKSFQIMLGIQPVLKQWSMDHISLWRGFKIVSISQFSKPENSFSFLKLFGTFFFLKKKVFLKGDFYSYEFFYH